MGEDMDQRTARNARVSARYDELMREGKHGHYETMFRVVREEVESALSARAAQEGSGQAVDEFETRADGVRVRRDRWEFGIRRIVALLWGNRHEFEIDDVVEAVRALAPKRENDDGSDDEGLVRSVERLATPPAQAEPQGAELSEAIEWLSDYCRRPSPGEDPLP